MTRRSHSILRFRLRSVLLAVLALGMILAAGNAVSKSAWWNGDVRPIRLDAAAWRRADDIGNYRSVRSQMVGDLLGKYDFHGWSRTSLNEVLGESDWNPKTSGFASWDIAYYLGLERGGSFSLDDECLVFRFDTNDRVVDYRTAVN